MPDGSRTGSSLQEIAQSGCSEDRGEPVAIDVVALGTNMLVAVARSLAFCQPSYMVTERLVSSANR